MTTLSISPKKSTFTKSIKLSQDTTQALERFAKQENRSVHYLLVTAVQEYIDRKQQEYDYQEYIKNRVMTVYDRIERQGARSDTSQAVFARLHQEMQTYANEQKK